jgi:hypothetical protein
MKKLIPLILLLMACRPASHDGYYVNHTEGQYSIADDTLEVRDGIIISRCGFQKTRDGKKLPKAFKTQQRYELHPQFKGNKLILINATYEKL